MIEMKLKDLKQIFLLNIKNKFLKVKINCLKIKQLIST